MNNDPLREKSKNFALSIIQLYKSLCTEQKEFVMSKQILKSGTSIGANIAEARCTISDKDFLSKMYNAFKECSETLYWLDLLHQAGYISEEDCVRLSSDCGELYRMLSSTTKSLSQRLNR